MGIPRIFYAGYPRMLRDIQKLASLLPDDIDGVVGVPRSGTIAAGMLATQLNLPLGWPTTDGVLFSEKPLPPDRPSAEPRRVAVVEDASSKGTFVTEMAPRLRGRSPVWCSVYVRPGALPAVEYYAEQTDARMLFPWNMFKRSFTPRMLFALDGVLCRAPSDEEDDDGERYLEFITTARSIVPRPVKIGGVVTDRLEKYRKPTEQWLERNGIAFGRLVMCPCRTPEERRSSNGFIDGKVKCLRKSDAPAFVEADDAQARIIWEKTGRQVICTSTDRGYGTA